MKNSFFDRLLTRRTTLLAGGAILAASGMPMALAQQVAPTTPRKHGFGWKPDFPDLTNERLSAPPTHATPPDKMDLTSQLPDPYDQGQLSSCASNATAAALQYARMKAGQTPPFKASALFVYYFARKSEHDVLMDQGSSISSAIQAVTTYGVPQDVSWPSDDIAGDPGTGLFPADAKAIVAPGASVLAEALPHKVIAKSQVAQNSTAIEGVIAAGFPVIFGFVIYQPKTATGDDGLNLDESTTDLTFPDRNTMKASRYAHAVMAVGYDRSVQKFIIRNSWGSQSNNNGNFLMDYSYVTNPNLSSAFWTVYMAQHLINDQ